jgi:proline iminopeptidase
MKPRLSPFLLVVGVACSSEQPGPHRTSVGELPPAPVSREGYVMTPDAVRLYYRVAGAGPDTIVFVHGGPGGSLEEVVAGLVPLTEHHAVIFYDQRGGGRSSRPIDTTHLTAAYQIEDLDHIRRRFGLETMQLVGHSYGALLAATYAIAHPSAVESLVLVAGIGPRRTGVWERMDSVTRVRLGQAKGRRVEEAKRRIRDPAADAVAACRDFISLVLPARLADPERMMPRLVPHFCTEDAATIRYAFSVAGPAILESYGHWDLRGQLSTLHVPTLVVHGTEDVFPMDIAREWTAALPRAKLVQIPAAGHFPFAERPELFWPVIEEFLAASQE